MWDQLPRSFRLTGLVPQNPWKWLVWEALEALPNRAKEYAFMPTGNVWNVFTDGTCSDPHCMEESLAAWSTVVQGRGTLSCGVLPGVQQTILRAEFFAVYSAINWVAGFHGDLHLWVDNQNVVDHLRDLRRGVVDAGGFEQFDLWDKIQSLLPVAVCDIYVHKVASHTTEGSSCEVHADFARLGNAAADFQAGISNQSRHPFFAQIWDGYLSYRRVWGRRVRLLTSMAVDFARFDCDNVAPSNLNEDHDVEEVSPLLCIDTRFNNAQFHVHLLPLLDSDWFLTKHDFRFRQVGGRLVEWLIQTDQSASTMRLVSYVELYVCFRRVFLGPYFWGRC